ncbi:MAG TPA: methyltransferase domain-containing protein [Magnetospirillaceae bacterium]|jgi:SAM-dependent methyltransferase
MWNDVVDLRDFYGTALGQMARRMIRRRIRLIWPDLRDMRLLALGFGTPYLRPYITETERVLAVMPAAQGVMHWPPEGPGVVALAEETDLPLPDRSVDRVLVIHCLESTENLRGTMREIWRVLADGGRVLMVAVNRRSLWARLERTPFGQGRPYTPSQLSRLLRDTMFMPLQTQSALFMPPFRSRMVLRSAPAWEKIGERFFPRFAGVVLIEATKQLYAGTAVRTSAESKRAYVALPSGFRRDSDL